MVPFGPNGEPMSDEGLLAGMHKVRMVYPGLTDEERAVSRNWLLAHNMRVH